MIEQETPDLISAIILLENDGEKGMVHAWMKSEEVTKHEQVKDDGYSFVFESEREIPQIMKEGIMYDVLVPIFTVNPPTNN